MGIHHQYTIIPLEERWMVRRDVRCRPLIDRDVSLALNLMHCRWLRVPVDVSSGNGEEEGKRRGRLTQTTLTGPSEVELWRELMVLEL